MPEPGRRTKPTSHKADRVSYKDGKRRREAYAQSGYTMDLWQLKPDDRVRASGDALVEVLADPEHRHWIRLRYLEDPGRSERRRDRRPMPCGRAERVGRSVLGESAPITHSGRPPASSGLLTMHRDRSPSPGGFVAFAADGGVTRVTPFLHPSLLPGRDRGCGRLRRPGCL